MPRRNAASDPETAETPRSLRVWPSPDLPPTDYLPGIGADGADLPADVAADLVARGLAVTTPPAAPAAPEKE